MELIYSYSKEDKTQSFDEFWENLDGEFDKEDKAHVLYMIKQIAKSMDLDDYGYKKLEATIKTELPFFAKTRQITKNWLINNFLY